MLSLSQVWGTKFFPTAIEPNDLATMLFASAMNLTGARALAESAAQFNCNRAASVARPFAEAAQFIQREYRRHPDYQIVILGQGGVASHAVVSDSSGQIVFDTYCDSRFQYLPGHMYTYSLGDAGVNEMSVQASKSFTQAYEDLQNAGLWTDNAGSWDQTVPRGLDYL